MSSNTQPEIDREVRASLEARDLHRAATRALENLGPDVLCFLSARLGDRAQANQAYLQFSEDLWVGLPAFRWESNLRTWMFVLARSAAMRVSRKWHRQGDFTRLAVTKPLADRMHTSTSRSLRLGVRNQMRQMCQRLDEDDQTLLILRIDRKLEWSELAVVMSEVAADAPQPDVQRATTRLRARFRCARERLRALAESEGLLPRRTDST